MADTKFSIVIVNFNKFNLLHNCLKSISNQFKKNNYEVIFKHCSNLSPLLTYIYIEDYIKVGDLYIIYLIIYVILYI